MLDKSKRAKKARGSVLQLIEDWEEEANSQAVRTELGGLCPHPDSPAQPGRGGPYGSNFPESSLSPVWHKRVSEIPESPVEEFSRRITMGRARDLSTPAKAKWESLQRSCRCLREPR